MKSKVFTLLKIILLITACILFYAIHDRIGLDDYVAAVLAIMALVIGVLTILILDDFKRYMK